MSNRRFLIVVLGWLLYSSIGNAADRPKQADPKKQQEDLEKAQKLLRDVDRGLDWLSRAALLGAILKDSEELKSAAELLDSLRRPVEDLRRATDQLLELKDKQRARVDAQRLFEGQKVREIREYEGKLEAVRQRTDAIPVGLVSDKDDDRFLVSGELLVRNPQEAEKRFRAYLAAIRANVRYLENHKRHMEELRLRASAASQVLLRLSEGIEKAARAGILTKVLVEKYLEVEHLVGKVHRVQAGADLKLKAIDRVLPVEKRRHEALQSTIKTVLGFDN